MNTVFGTAPIGGEVWLRILAIAAADSLVVAVDKRLRRRAGGRMRRGVNLPNSSVHIGAGGRVPLVTCAALVRTLCKPVAFEVRMQTCPAGAVAGLVSASGSSADLSAEMRFRRGRPCGGGAGSEEGHIVMSDQDHPRVDQQFFGGVDWGGSFHSSAC